jgi:hypothetical protein
VIVIELSFHALLMHSNRLLVYLLLSDRGWDAQFRDAYLEEALSRQVSWFAKEHKHPELLVLETDPIAVYRLKTTFNVRLTPPLLLFTLSHRQLFRVFGQSCFK